ncbi:MAG: cytochrome-c peroxidase [Bacteroidia bacterium]|nr:cytochrome-c peroxidase [Bacteroidia bacterium]
MSACSSNETKQTEKSAEQLEGERYDESLAEKLSAFKPLSAPSGNGASDPKVKLGLYLYHDKRLSKNQTISCNSCHNLATFGVDNLPTSPGDSKKNGERNSPTVLNAALHSAQFWDGRAKDVEEQAGMPILNPVEMEIPNEKFLIDRLKKVGLYQDLFKQAFPEEKDPITYTNLRKAIGAFERQLITPSRFDEYLNGKKDALTVAEKKGLMSFVTLGCPTCHNGPLLGGNSFQRFGAFGEYWKLTGSKKPDVGRKAITKNDADEFVFKVPSLRNVTKTAPYFHDGSVAKLEDAIKIMAQLQLNRPIQDDEAKNIATFLNSLTADVPAEYKTAPKELNSNP